MQIIAGASFRVINPISFAFREFFGREERGNAGSATIRTAIRSAEI